MTNQEIMDAAKDRLDKAGVFARQFAYAEFSAAVAQMEHDLENSLLTAPIQSMLEITDPRPAETDEDKIICIHKALLGIVHRDAMRNYYRTLSHDEAVDLQKALYLIQQSTGAYKIAIYPGVDVSAEYFMDEWSAANRE